MLYAERSEGKAREFLNLLEQSKAGLGSNVPFKICRTCQHWVGRCQQIARTHHPECFEVTTTGGKNTRAKNAVFLQSHVPVDDRAFQTKVSGQQQAMRSDGSSGCDACRRHLPDRVENVTCFVRYALHPQVHNLRAFVNNTTDHVHGNLALLPKVPRPQFAVGEHVDVLRQTQPDVNKGCPRSRRPTDCDKSWQTSVSAPCAHSPRELPSSAGPQRAPPVVMPLTLVFRRLLALSQARRRAPVLAQAGG